MGRGCSNLPNWVTAMSTPATNIRDALHQGFITRDEIAAHTGYDLDFVNVVVDQLLHAGIIQAASLRTTCPDGGCSGCNSPTGGGCASNPVSLPMPKVR